MDCSPRVLLQQLNISPLTIKSLKGTIRKDSLRKCFMLNHFTSRRFSIDSIVSQRALREIYLKPFQIALKDANPWAFMTA